jgi:RNA methyltransferase, TrmH family
VISDANPRLHAARQLTRRRGRQETDLFLAEGVQAVREALRHPDVVVEVFATAQAQQRYGDVLAGVTVLEVSPRAAATLSETVTPQGLVAVCRRVDIPLSRALAHQPQLVAGLVTVTDPGNAGTVLRTADAAGANAVVLAGASVDIYNGKAVRASAGSLFHLDVVTDADPVELISAGHEAGLSVLATTAAGERDLDELADEGTLGRPALWLFGNEAHGLPSEILAAVTTVRVPIYGAAESLNLAATAAVCLYASARTQRAAAAKLNRPANLA